MKNILFLFIMFILALNHSMAQDRNPAPHTALSLKECIDAALDFHPSLKTSQAKLDGSIARREELQTGRLPKFVLSARVFQLSEIPEFGITLPLVGRQTLFPSIDHSYGARLSFQQPIFTGSRISGSIEMADKQVDMLRSEMTREKSALVLSVTTAYWSVYRALEWESHLKESFAQLDAHLYDVQNMLKQGLLTQLDLLKVETQRSEIRVRQIETTSAVRLTRMRLNSLIGHALMEEIILADHPELESSGEYATLDDVLAKARRDRPEISVTRSMRALQEAAISVSKSGWFPQISIQANYDYARPNPRIIPPTDKWNDTWDVGLMIQWNIWDWFSTSKQVAQSVAKKNEIDAQAVQVENNVTLDAAGEYFKLIESREKITAAKQGVEYAKESYRVATEKFKQGLLSNRDLLDAHMVLLNANLVLSNALADHAIQRQSFKHALGE